MSRPRPAPGRGGGGVGIYPGRRGGGVELINNPLPENPGFQEYALEFVQHLLLFFQPGNLGFRSDGIVQPVPFHALLFQERLCVGRD